MPGFPRECLSTHEFRPGSRFKAKKAKWRLGDAGAASFGIMKYDSGGMPLPRTDPAHAVAHIDPIGAAGAGYRPMADRKDHALPSSQRHDLRARLQARSLLREHEVAAGEVDIRPRQQKCDLQRKDVLAVATLLQA